MTEHGPENLPGMLLAAFWRSLGEDPFATLIVLAGLSTAGVLLALVGALVRAELGGGG